jgi:hypothetical protein
MHWTQEESTLTKILLTQTKKRSTEKICLKFRVESRI